MKRPAVRVVWCADCDAQGCHPAHGRKTDGSARPCRIHSCKVKEQNHRIEKYAATRPPQNPPTFHEQQMTAALKGGPRADPGCRPQQPQERDLPTTSCGKIALELLLVERAGHRHEDLEHEFLGGGMSRRNDKAKATPKPAAPSVAAWLSRPCTRACTELIIPAEVPRERHPRNVMARLHRALLSPSPVKSSRASQPSIEPRTAAAGNKAGKGHCVGLNTVRPYRRIAMWFPSGIPR